MHTGCPPLAMGSDNVNQALECPKSRSSRQHRADLLALGPHPDSRVCAVVAEVIQHFIETCIQKGGEGAPLRDPQANGEGWDMALATRAWLAALALSLSMAVLCCHRVASRCRHLSIPLPAVLVKLSRLCCNTLEGAGEARGEGSRRLRRAKRADELRAGLQLLHAGHTARAGKPIVNDTLCVTPCCLTRMPVRE